MKRIRSQAQKIRLYRLFLDMYRKPFDLTDEDRAWLNMPPVGREYGSPDYERLMNQSPEFDSE